MPTADLIVQLHMALKPFVEAYRKTAEPIGDSDLYDEQPRSVSVTLGDCRRAAAILWQVENPLGLRNPCQVPSSTKGQL